MLKKKNELVPNISLNTRGRWGYVIELGTDPLTNKRKQKTSFKYKSKKLATIAANKWIDDYEIINDSVTTSLTDKSSLDNAYKEFMKCYSNRTDIKPSTIKTRKNAYVVLEKELKDVLIKNFSLDLFQEYFDKLAKTYSINTLNSVKVCLALICEYLIECDLLIQNYAKDITIETKKIYADNSYVDTISQKYLEREELTIFLELAKQNLSFRYYVICELLANSGMRVGELAVLQWKDLKDNKISIYKTYFSENSRSGEYQMLTTKSSNSTREIPVSQNVIDLLHEWKQEQDKEKEVSATWDSNNLIFSNENGRGYPCSPRNIAYHFNKITKLLKENGINKNVTPHTLRHTHISLLAQADVSLSSIKARIGHGDGKVTEKIYLHITKESQNKALEKFESLF